MKSRKEQHQGRLNDREKVFALMLQRKPGRYFTTLDVCRLTGCVSARDRIRKLQANGVKIGPAKLMRINDNGSRIYGWRVA